MVLRSEMGEDEYYLRIFEEGGVPDQFTDFLTERMRTYPMDQHNDWLLQDQLRQVKKHYKRVTGETYKLNKFTKWKADAVRNMLSFFDAHGINGDNVDVCLTQSEWMALLKEQFPQHSQKLILSAFRYIRTKVFWKQATPEVKEFDYPWDGFTNTYEKRDGEKDEEADGF